MQDELRRLIAEQQADDTHRQAPQRFGAAGREPVLSTDALGLVDLSGDLDGATVSGQSLGSDYDVADGPALNGRFKQQRLGPIWSGESEPESEQARIVREAVAEMTEAQQETFRLIFGERLSYREAAEQLGIDVSSVRDRVATLKRIVTRALVSAAGGEA